MSAAAFFIYLVQVSVYAAVLWGIYCAVWRSKPLLRGSRVYLLCSLVLPLVLPLIRLPVADGSAVAAYRITLPEVMIGGGGAAASGNGFSWALTGLCIYAAGAVALLLLYGRSYILLFGKLARSKHEKRDGYTLITGAGIGPGTIGRRIFFPADDVNDAILRHELGHIRAGHRYDAALMQLLHVAMWASPAHWLMRRELKLVHEYEADRAAVSSLSDMTAYGELMLSQSLGIQNTSIAHSFFHHPLKLRINMLQTAQHAKRRRVTFMLTGLLIALFAGAVVLAQTKKPKTVKHSSGNEQAVPATDVIFTDDSSAEMHRIGVTAKDTVDVIMFSEKHGKPQKLVVQKPTTQVSSTMADGRVVYKFVDKMPSFNGNLSDWLSSNLHYPDAARKAGQQGRSVTQFIVNEDGSVSNAKVVRSSGHPLLDTEALRAINAMPRWNPGGQQGQPVPVYFTMPVTFKLDK